MLHALLIDDEASARVDLRAKLAAHADVTVVGEAATIRAARALLASADYDLVFLDVQLIGGESFQLLPDVRPGASIVFATAHDRYAVRAFACNAIDYLLKPIDPARLTAALHRAAVAHATSGSRTCFAVPNPPAHWTAPPALLDPIMVRRLAALRGQACEVALTADERVYLRQCLEMWEDSLAPTHVLRAQGAQTTRCPRTVRYERDTEPTRLYLSGASVSRAGRWWRALRARFAS